LDVITVLTEPVVLDTPLATTWPQVEIIRQSSVFAQMHGEWDELLDASDAGIFNSWEWLYSWYRQLGADRALRILAARAPDGRLLGLMPLGLETRRVAGRRVRRLAFLGETHVGSDYLDIVARRGYEKVVAWAFAGALREQRVGWDVLDLLDFDAQSPTLPVLREAFGSPTYTVRSTDRSCCPFEEFAASETFPVFLRRTRRRENYLRRLKWLEQQPGYRIEIVTDPARLETTLPEFFRLHALRWAPDGGSEAITSRKVEAFHRDATRLLAERGRLALYMMRVGDQALAAVYGIIHRGTFIYYLSGYDPAWASKSVGLVLIGETFKDSLAAGLHAYDFLSGSESYKADWTTQQHQTIALRIHPTHGVGGWLTREEHARQAVRTFMKKNLPVGWTEKLRHLQHRLAAFSF
jgi:CelD/BcsL family acetyltransferase involved in cellulose biosynthesis